MPLETVFLLALEALVLMAHWRDHHPVNHHQAMTTPLLSESAPGLLAHPWILLADCRSLATSRMAAKDLYAFLHHREQHQRLLSLMDEVSATLLVGWQQYTFANRVLGLADQRKRNTNECHIEYQWAADQVRRGAENVGRVQIAYLPYYLILRQHFPTLSMQKLETLWNTLQPLLEMADRRDITLDQMLTLDEYLGVALRVQAFLHAPTSSTPRALLETLIAVKSTVISSFEQNILTEFSHDVPIERQTNTMSATLAPASDVPRETEPPTVCMTDDLTMLPETEVLPTIAPSTDGLSPVPISPLVSTSPDCSETVVIREVEPVAAAEVILPTNFSELSVVVAPGLPPSLSQIIAGFFTRYRELEAEGFCCLRDLPAQQRGLQRCVVELEELRAAVVQLQTAESFATLSHDTRITYRKVLERTEECIGELHPFRVAP